MRLPAILGTAVVVAAGAAPAALRADDASPNRGVAPVPAEPSRGPAYEDAIQPLFKASCVRCHGPNDPEAGLDLSRAARLVAGGESGPALAGSPDDSLLWRRVSAGEMPPDEPLPASEQETLRRWIIAGAPGLAAAAQGEEHWAFARLRRPATPAVDAALPGAAASRPVGRPRTSIDAHLQASLLRHGLSLAADADRATLIRRASFLMTGLPPTPAEVAAFVAEPAADAYERLVERLLASPRFGEHWGKHWLDAAGYADTNGYFSKESDRKHAWRYRDYVVAAFNADKPFDRFVREQLAGDELADVQPGSDVTPEQRELLIATHFLRNGPDGTDDSAPSPEAQRIDRYAALEGVEQVVSTSLLGLSLKCARCHDHKFEPLTQREYYQAQAIFYPAFNPEQWVKPRDRVIRAATAAERKAWSEVQASITGRLAAARDEYDRRARGLRIPGKATFRDLGTGPDAAAAWSVAPATAPVFPPERGTLAVDGGVESWLATPPVEWIAAEVGGVVEATFVLADDRTTPDDAACGYFAYVLSATNFAGLPPGREGGGNLYFEGRRTGGASVYRLREAAAAARYESVGGIGTARYRPGGSYGVRITNLGGGWCRVDHLCDHVVDGEPLVLDQAELPPGPFAFYRFPGRNFRVRDVSIERHPPPARHRGDVLFVDDGTRPVTDLWSAAAPGDAPPEVAVLLDKPIPSRHAAHRQGTRLRIVADQEEESWLCTQQAFDWTPDAVGQAIQATFDLVADRVTRSGAGDTSPPAGHVAYYLGANNFGRRRTDAPGNLLVAGAASGPTQVHRGYPGGAAAEPLGTQPTTPGRRYGVRVTNAGGGRFRLEHLVDDIPDGPHLAVSAADLPDGGFGFWFGAQRSFVVENVVVTAGELAAHDDPEAVARARRFREETARFHVAKKDLETLESAAPGIDVAWVTDVSPKPPRVFLLNRGLYDERGREMAPAGFDALADGAHPFEVVPATGGKTTGRRLALANWLLAEDSRPAALVARVRANWIWQHCFGTGLAPTPENLGLSGAAPTHPELLEHLAAEFVQSGWSLKHVLRLVVHSSAFRQSSAAHAAGLAADPGNRQLWRFPVQRLDAESIRDAMLAVGGELDETPGGPPVMLEGIDGQGAGDVVEPVVADGRQRRSLYVQRRRNMLPTFLQVFDFPAIAATCGERPRSTVPLQSLAQLNSAFCRQRALALANRLAAGADDDAQRVRLAFELCLSRPPAPAEVADAVAFLDAQRATYGAADDAARKALADFCQMVLVSNEFLYID